ncbi:MAG: DUF1580 domain-containing protein [Planctomyces sp.]|nr:DUF1580 domain-containing protein [Planctomyces sp.]
MQADQQEYIPLPQASAHIPGSPHRSTPVRWALHGLHIGGQIIRLRTVRVGGRRFTTAVWIEEFLAACDGRDQQPVAMTPARRRRQAEAAVDALASMGVG